MKVHVRKNDNVVVISGKDKGKTGEVLKVYPKTGKVLVAGVNIVKKHQKANRSQAESVPPRRIHSCMGLPFPAGSAQCENGAERDVQYGTDAG